MLDPMRSDISAAPTALVVEAVAGALAALTSAELLRLKWLAQLRARLLPGLEWEELLNEALLRALDGSRRWPEGVPLLAFIAGIMRSLVDGRVEERRRQAERALVVCETPVVTAPDAGGPLDVVRDDETGLVVEAEPRAVAAALARLLAEPETARRLGEAGRPLAEAVTWDAAIARLLA